MALHNEELPSLKYQECRTSLVVQWLRIYLPMQGTWVWSLVRELRSRLLWATAERHIQRDCAPTLESTLPCSATREATAVRSLCTTVRSPCAAREAHVHNKDPLQLKQKTKKIKIKNSYKSIIRKKFLNTSNACGKETWFTTNWKKYQLYL